jgi:DNA-binding GntR family transcriptional regulator
MTVIASNDSRSSSHDGDKISSTSLASEVFDRLRNEILLGKLRPNEQLIEIDLAERLQVSRTPVRESLQRLAAEGLIISNRRRWQVYEHSQDEIREIYEARLALEGYAAKLACERATDEQIAEIAELHSHRAEQLLVRTTLVEANDRFHGLIARSAGNARLSGLIERNRLYYFNNRVASLYNEHDLAVSGEQHQAIVDALLKRDGDEAERVTRAHVQNALQLILEKLH